MFSRLLRIGAAVILASALISACLIGFLIYILQCSDYPTTRRDHIPAISAPPRLIGESVYRMPLQDPIIRLEQLQHDQVTLQTYMSVDQVFEFYKQQLILEGWGPDYNINKKTHQMFIVNKQACPYYGLDITVKPIGAAGTTVIVDPYLNDICDCN